MNGYVALGSCSYIHRRQSNFQGGRTPAWRPPVHWEQWWYIITPSLAHCRERTQYEIKPNGIIIITYYYPPLLSHRHRVACAGFPSVLAKIKNYGFSSGPIVLFSVFASTDALRQTQWLSRMRPCIYWPERYSIRVCSSSMCVCVCPTWALAFDSYVCQMRKPHYCVRGNLFSAFSWPQCRSDGRVQSFIWPI